MYIRVGKTGSLEPQRSRFANPNVHTYLKVGYIQVTSAGGNDRVVGKF
jgi:hypothetical protein